MANKWFETVAVAQRRAERHLPKSVYGALIAGAEAGLTIDDNVNAFREIGFAPHVAGLPATREMATTVMGQDISLPVIISPTGVQAVHPDGEVAVARAAAARGTAMGLSSFASKPIEQVIAANPKLFFQMYWVGTRDDMAARMERGRLLLSGDRLFHFVLGEHALRAALAEPDVMAEQLRHLLEVSRLPRLRLGILPTRIRHYMTFCGFWIFDNRVVQLETYSAAITITQPREIAMYAKVFEHYSSRALYGQQARDLIGQVLADLAANCTSSNSEKHS